MVTPAGFEPATSGLGNRFILYFVQHIQRT
jgi:hypothetical protein